MPLDTLVFPEESPTPDLAIKRALLTYNKVFLVEPSECDVMPPELMFQAMMPPGFPPFGPTINTGNPVCPIIRHHDYENNFDRMIERFKPAIQAGALEVISTYKETIKPGVVAIGGLPNTGYPLHPGGVLRLLRALGSNQTLLREALGTWGVNRELIEAASEVRTGTASFKINDSEALPPLDLPPAYDSNRHALTRIAMGRIASVIKYYGFCDSKQLVPFIHSPATSHFMSVLMMRSNRAIAKATEDSTDTPWQRISSLQNVILTEAIDMDKVNAASVREVIRARTSGWGKAGDKRDKVFERLHEIIKHEANYEVRAREEIANYLREAENLCKDRANLRTTFFGDMLPTATNPKHFFLLAGGAAGAVGTMFTGGSALLMLLGVATWASQLYKDYRPALRELQQREATLNRSSGLGLYRKLQPFR
ncbi:MAG: hypothetical protein CL583_15275 [Alteromonadaceae bacterium]|nr:hypothetical protein [Alteromonadaceae bacterium]|tara:strand:+ start:2269 stop:3540 length:1272 start_codon:yes stop_codon:yes gene_type:complete